ncbi:MAG: uridine phosphorylase [Pseudomonadota bacterium]
MSPFEPHHLRVAAADLTGNGARGRVFLIPGSLARVEAISAFLTDLRVFSSPRRLDVHVGRYERDGVSVDVGTCPTGMGCPSLGIIVTELMELGVRCMVRVGSAGSLQPDAVHAGALVIATGAVRDEAASDAYAPREVPALAHPDWVLALRRAARARGLGSTTFEGLVHTKDSLYGREFAMGPRAAVNHAYMAELRALGVVATEMECSHLFMLAQARAHECRPVDAPAGPERVRVGAILAVLGEEGVFEGTPAARTGEEHAVMVALDAALVLMGAERTAGA